jgi:hypothetical protein
MIRKSTFFLNLANTGKVKELKRVMEESKRVVNISKRFRLPEHLDPVKFEPVEK